MNISVSLSAFTGNPELFAKFCKTEEKNCTLIQEDINLIFEDTTNATHIENDEMVIWWSLNPGID